MSPLLPGQANNAKGVSNLLFGVNWPHYYSTVGPDSAAQTVLSNIGIKVIRVALDHQGPAGQHGAFYTHAELDSLASAVSASGAVMLAILPSNNGGDATSFNLDTVTYLGSRCNLYEYANEPDINNITSQQYFTAWAAQIPNLRAANASAAFGGPVLGVFNNMSSYLGDANNGWLTLIKKDGRASLVPDFVSIHVYPDYSGGSGSSHPGTPSSTQAIQDALNIGAACQTTQNLIVQIFGHQIPMAMTEWDVDAAFAQPYRSDPTFASQFYANAITGMVNANVAMACQFETRVDYINPNVFATPTTNAITQYGPFSGSSGGVTTGLTATPSSLKFTAVAGGTDAPTQNVVITSNSSTSGTLSPAITYTPSQNSGWLNITISSATISTSGSSTVTFSVGSQETTLPAGTYTASVAYSVASGASTTITINVTITASSTVDGIVTAAGGAHALLLLNNWTAQNATVSTTMTTSDAGGLAFNVVDTSNFYDLAVSDASGGGSSTSTWTDNFSTNTSSSYTSTYNATAHGNVATWTYGTNTLTASGGLYALYLYNGWTAQNVDLTCTMTRSDFGGLAFRAADSNNFYELAVRDASSTAGANTFAFFKTVAGTRTQIGSTPAISFTRGASHTIRVTMSGSVITAYFDGSSLVSFSDTSLTAAGKAGLRDDLYGGASSAIFTSVSFLDNDGSSSNGNKLQLYKTVAGTRAALGSSAAIAFTRGTTHVIQAVSANSAGTTTITVSFDGVTKITQTDASSPLGSGQVGMRTDTVNSTSSAIFTAFSATSNDVSTLVQSTVTDTAVPSHNYLDNNNFTYGNGAWAEFGTITGRFAFPVSGTFGASSVATLTFSNNAVGTAFQAQAVDDSYVVPGQTYCLSGYINVTSTLVNASALLQLVFQDASGNTIATTPASYVVRLGGAVPYSPAVSSTVTSSAITSTSGAQRFSVRGVCPVGTVTIQAVFGGMTTSTTNSGTVTFTGMQLEPVWFPNLYSYPTPICDFLQPDCVTLPDGTASRYDRILTGFITHLTASYEGTTRTWDVEVTAADTLLETSALVNAEYAGVTDVAIIQGIVNVLPNSPLFAADVTLQSGTPSALAYRNVPICVAGSIQSSLQFADATLREVVNTLADITDFTFGVDAYYNVYYYPPFYSQCPYGFSSSPDTITTFPYYDYSIEYDATQLHNALRVTGTTFSTTVVEAWNLQDGSHPETVQSSKTVNVTLRNLPNALPTITVAGTAITTGEDTGTGYGTSQSIVSLSAYGIPGLVSFPSPGYAAGTALAVTYAYDTLAYVQVQAPDSVAQYGRALYSKINDTNLGSIASAVTRGEAELQAYAQPRITIKFKTQKLVQVGQVLVLTSALDGIVNGHYSVQRVTATYLGNGLNQYEVQAGTYVDDFVDFFRNTQKSVNRVDHDPAAPVQQTNNLQQDSLSISDSLNIHT